MVICYSSSKKLIQAHCSKYRSQAAGPLGKTLFLCWHIGHISIYLIPQPGSEHLHLFLLRPETCKPRQLAPQCPTIQHQHMMLSRGLKTEKMWYIASLESPALAGSSSPLYHLGNPTENYLVIKKWKWKPLRCVQLFVTPWTIQSMKFSRPEYWSG